MATTDISRASFSPGKHYASVRMQQGRVIVDDDWNESERIANEERRLGLADVIGPAGSPDNGFQITDADIKNGKIGFTIQPGTFYVGGLRLELEQVESYRAQSDWLQWPGKQQDAPNADRVDLVCLEAYQEPVSAVEDGELIEVALGGPDTSTRLRTMQRVHVLTGVEGCCRRAWEAMVGKLAGSLSEENELLPDTWLKVTYEQGAASADLCSPSVQGGYLGAENQAIRVQLVEENRLTWGFDNAAPLYRVQLDAARKQVTLLTAPKDQAHWPLAGQVVEILPWSAVLPNNEKVAELWGHLSRVATSYDPDKRQLTLTSAVPTAGFDDWKDRSDKADLEEPGVYYFMRVWDRGADKTSEPKLAFTPGTPLTLGKTGLQVTITGNDQVPGDYWIIAARPETPNQVVPWDLEVGRRPHGVRRFYAPLALVHWQFADGVFSQAEVHDCRPRFLPLTQERSCCRYTVGDGKVSHGHFDSIEEALAHLPPAGGQICLLPGEHGANAVLAGKVDIVITGCGKHTRVRPRDGHLAEPIFQVVDSRSIVLEHMDLIAAGGTAIVLEGSEAGSLRDVEVAYNRILAYENGIRVKQGVGINIHHNTIRMLDKAKAGVGVYMLAEDSLIERNDIGVVPAEAEPPRPERDGDLANPVDPCIELEDFYRRFRYLPAYLGFQWTYAFALMPSNPFLALGGVQIAGGSERVRVLENRIRGGAGNGVTLGSGLDLSALRDPADLREERGVQEHKVRSRGVLQGVVASASGDALSGVTLSFRNLSDNKLYAAVTDSSGRFKVDAPAGEYALSAPGYRVEGVETLRTMLSVTLSKAELPDVDLEGLAAFLYEIQVEGNDIAGMGLSGIGVPLVTLEELQRLIVLLPYAPGLSALVMLALLTGTLGGLVVDASVCRNHIRRCLRNVFDAGLLLLAQRRGMGGISLGLCENLVVCENRIEDNGVNHLSPVCGVYVSFADQVVIERNQIVNNGPLALDAVGEARRGIRGGVVVGLATSYAMAELLVASTGGVAVPGAAAEEYRRVANVATAPAAFAAGLAGYLRKGRQAARIHDNIVEQPVGHALAVLAWGPVSVANNQFNTDFAAQSAEAGALVINNMGRPLHRQGTQRMMVAQNRTLLPNGNTLFCDNQTTIGLAGSSLYAQKIVTLDDLGFDGNQSDVLAGQALLTNTLLVAATLRASNSRFKEPAVAEQGQARLSLFTGATRMNNTVSNQGDHCIVALCTDPTREVELANQALAKTARECQAAGEPLKSPLRALLFSLDQ